MSFWSDVTDESQIQQIIVASSEKPQLIFKHSTRCSVSSGAKFRLTKGQLDLSEKFDLHILDLIAHRNISNTIASTFSIRHESPQVILVDKQKAVYSASHFAIEVDDLLSRI